MPTRLSDLTDTLRQLGEIRVTDWDFRAFLRKDIKDLEIGPSLRKLGNAKVMEWDFKTALPAVHKIAHQEVDVVGWVKRVAHYKVMEWDFRDALADRGESAEPARNLPDAGEVEELVGRLRSFVQYVAVNLIDEPERAQFRVQQIGPRVVRFKLVVTAKDQKHLVGRDGSTAASLRNVLKGVAAESGVTVLLQILTPEEELALSLRETEGR